MVRRSLVWCSSLVWIQREGRNEGKARCDFVSSSTPDLARAASAVLVDDFKAPDRATGELLQFDSEVRHARSAGDKLDSASASTNSIDECPCRWATGVATVAA